MSSQLSEMPSTSGYSCGVPGCSAKYQRKEHLSRHEAQHTRRKFLQCPTCSREFGRSDTLRRHLQTVHGIAEPSQIKHACTHCRNQKIRCQGEPPCINCQRRGVDCSLQVPKRAEVLPVPGQPDPGSSKSPNEAPDTQSKSQSQSATRQSTPHQPRLRRTEIEDRFVGIYFELFHPHWPFIHRGTFIEFETPLLVQSMVAIGLWMTGEETSRSKAVDLHYVLGRAIRQQTEQWDGSESEDASPSCKWPIPTYQAILLHIISAGMMKSSGILQPNLKPSLAPADADLLRRLVTSCKRLGMFYYPNILARFSKKEPPQYIWVNIEEIKRFNLALFKLCRSVSAAPPGQGQGDDSSHSLTVGRDEEGGNWGFPARELQFPLPRNTPLYNALTPEEWFAADTPDLYRYSLHETLEEQWISRSADVLEIVGT